MNMPAVRGQGVDGRKPYMVQYMVQFKSWFGVMPSMVVKTVFGIATQSGRLSAVLSTVLCPEGHHNSTRPFKASHGKSKIPRES